MLFDRCMPATIAKIITRFDTNDNKMFIAVSQSKIKGLKIRKSSTHEGLSELIWHDKSIPMPDLTPFWDLYYNRKGN